jgi:para-nitrobenzyl esterase
MQAVARAFAFTIIFTIICGAAVVAWEASAGARSGSCLASTISGPVEGLDKGGVCAFLGIPYAAPPVGDLRWKPPQPPSPWSLLVAQTPPSNCPTIQLPQRVLSGNENCLTLNVWVSNPRQGQPAPVLVWLHTGAFFGASANFPGHNGERIAVERGVIVVAPNYRVGPFGFLAHSALTSEDPLRATSGNFGLLDQRAALGWVRDNIAAFGGDPARVTVAGTSAGGESAGLHLVSPGSAGLFQRAIVQSGAVTVRWPTLAEAEAQGDAVALALGCTPPTDALVCLRSKTRDQVMLALTQGTQQVAARPNTVYWLPIVDGVEIPDQPRFLFQAGAFHRVPTMIGTNRDEGWGAFITRSFPGGPDAAQYEQWLLDEFGADAPAILAAYPVATAASPTDVMARLVGDVQFVCEARRMARLIERTRTPAFLYSYEHEIDTLAVDRVIHGVEANVLFGNNYLAPVFPAYSLGPSELSLHDAMAGYWTRFMATGNPNADDAAVVPWPAFKHPTGGGRGADKYLVLGPVIAEAKRLREQQCDLLEPLDFRSVLAGPPAWAP